MKNTKEQLLATLTEQVRYAFGLNGRLGIEAQNERHEAVVAANATLSLLEKRFGLDPEEVLASVDV